MSTNSNICKLMADGSVKSIYCHWDGYIEHNGRILNQYYRDPQKVEQLLSLGDISVLGEKVNASEAVEKYGFSYYFNAKFQELSEQEQERLDKESREHVIAYHRDRGERLQIKTYLDLEDFIMSEHEFQEFVYIMLPKDGADLCSTNSKDWKWFVWYDTGIHAVGDLDLFPLEENLSNLPKL
ncbi:hypothetical protein CYR83_09740 [Ligilactobacillus agilis]|uniref:Uncharacterized protein n=1 Tax=Ligilactobacillus agilis TaxID=1601 RepID=A0A2I2AAV3_9LACO|nr:hypothetical protein [Ligilactobacillus agilis]PLA76504.1 hypothetical protein CYR79_05620 [Ligilactobacillus agilis]PLA82305.1 hypothetical protein CYR83_09740 [Ligilactobacillus agilis]